MIKTKLCDLLGIDYPIIQGGMACVATAELASAVSQAGGLGIIGAGNSTPDYVLRQILKTRERTEKPFGVNIPLFSPYLEEVVEICIEEGVEVVATGAGNPGEIIPLLKGEGIFVIPVVSSVALARRVERMGADALVAEGMESGGHIGEVATLPLVPQVVDEVDIPVIAAGGIADGRGLAASLSLGAEGIQMGTRFICTEECIAHVNYKGRIVRAHDRATMTTGRRIGHPMRAIKNPMVHKLEEMESEGISEEEIMEFGTGRLRLAVMEGDIVNGSVIAGQSCGLVHEVIPVKELMERIIAEAEGIIGQLQGVVS